MVLAHKTDTGPRSGDIQISQDVTFDSMLLAANTLEGLKRCGFYKPSPVQLHGIPLGKCGFDLLLEAKSGTGKTAVFTVIALEKLNIAQGLQVVILAPTREIAFQICDVINQIGANYSGLVCEVVMGGLPIVEDIEKFKKNVHIVVGSPGRLRHLIQDKHINVDSVRLLVLDEADKLMEKSFLMDVNYIFSALPEQKQVIMSSATYPETTKTFLQKYAKHAQHVCPNSDCILLGVEQKITVVKSNTNIVRKTQYRFEELLKIISHKQFKQCLIFCNYQARVNELYKLLNKGKWPVEQLCGKQEQSDRLDALKTLQEYKCRILVSTDLAARGIDASNVDLVINFEPPCEWQTYLHRIGRAGRYGSYGMAITILCEGQEETKFKKILELINLDASKVTNFVTNETENVEDKQCGNILTNDTNSISLSKCPDINITQLELEHKEFMKSLISDSMSQQEFEDFDALCKSFDAENRQEFESFSDLVNSYETNKNSITNTDDSAYKSMGFNFLEKCHYPLLMKQLEAYSDRPVNTTHDKKKVVKDNNDNEICTVSDNKHHKKGRKEKCATKQEIEFGTVNYSNDCDYFEEESSRKALLDAGLPLAFGCTRKNRPIKGIIHEKEFINKEINAYQRNKNSKKEICNKNNTSQHTQIKIKKNHKGIDNGPFYTNNMYHYNNENKDRTLHKDDVNYCQNYINWYKQLKARVKFVEMTVYTNEICKLY